MAAIDVDAYLESLEPPALTLGGETFEGRHLSLEEWLPFEGTFQKLAEMGEPGTFDPAVWRKLVWDFCMLAFPVTFWQAINLRHKSVGQKILALPPAAQMKVMQTFLKSQQRALGTVVDEAEGSDDESQ